MPDFDSAHHLVRVTDNNGVRLLKFERNHQSSMRLDDPFETDIDYVAYLHLVMAVRPDALRTLVIGLGGGSLVKRMWRDYAPMHVDAVELDPAVVDLAYDYFMLPDDDRIVVYAEDGRDFLRLTDATYDIIVIDAFDDDHIPRHLMTEEFLRECRDRLSADGVIAYNLIGAVYGPHSKPFRSLHRTANNVWRTVWTFPLGIADDILDDTRNIVLLASDIELTEDELLTRIADRVGGLVTVPRFERFGEDLYRGGIRTGDVPLLTDESPERPRRRR